MIFVASLCTIISSGSLFVEGDASVSGLRGQGHERRHGAGTLRNQQLARKKKKDNKKKGGGGRKKGKDEGKKNMPKPKKQMKPEENDKPTGKRDKPAGKKDKDKEKEKGKGKKHIKKNKPDKKKDPQGKNKPEKKDQDKGKNKPAAMQSSQQGRNYPVLTRNYEARIIGGNEVQVNEYKFAVSLHDYIGHFCGGSLVTRNVVLTAAHCQGGSYSVVMGRHNLGTRAGQEIEMRNELPHPNYDSYTTDNDFMLVFLNEDANLNSNVGLVSLNSDSNFPSVSSSATVMGWGDTDIRDNYSTLSDVLNKVDVNVIKNEDCEDRSGYVGQYYDSYNDQITRNMLCAEANEQDSCQGDSGGPLVQTSGSRDVQVGVVSWGIGCAHDDFPGVYARVSSAYDWIEEEVCKGSVYAEEDGGFNCGSISANGGFHAVSPNPPPSPPSYNPPSPTPPIPSPPSDGTYYGWDDDCWWCGVGYNVPFVGNYDYYDDDDDYSSAPVVSGNSNSNYYDDDDDDSYWNDDYSYSGNNNNSNNHFGAQSHYGWDDDDFFGWDDR